MMISEDELKTEAGMKAFMDTMSSNVKMICLLPLEKYIEKTNFANTIGPFLDPTLWMNGHQSMDEWTSLAKDLNKIKQKYKHLVFRTKKAK